MNSPSSRKRHCILIVDANILIQDFWLEGSAWAYLRQRNFLGHTLVVPEIALEEAAAHIERRASDLAARISDSGFTSRLKTQHQKLFRRKRRSKETPEFLAKRYRAFIKKTLLRCKGLLGEPPTVDIPVLVKRSIARTKPFNKGDKGFRDTLIWLGVVDLVRQYKRISFVSSNTTDYANGSKLHGDLVTDLAPVLPDYIHFRYFTSLHEFIAFMDRDGSAGAEALKNALMSNGYSNFRLENWISETIGELLSHIELDGVQWAALPYWAEDPRLADLAELVGIEVRGERAAGPDRIEFLCDVALVGIFQCSILYSTWESEIHPIQVEWVDEKSSDVWTEVGVRAVGTFLLRLVFDLNIATIIEHDIIAIEHDIEAATENLESLREEFSEKH